ncbi:MAG: hypothetical protein V4681_03575 [Patescibacteria group bacterium]
MALAETCRCGNVRLATVWRESLDHGSRSLAHVGFTEATIEAMRAEMKTEANIDTVVLVIEKGDELLNFSVEVDDHLPPPDD